MGRVGFVGLGVMGAPMAGHLHRVGNDVVVWNRTPSRSESFRAKGIRVAESLGELGSSCSVVFICVNRTEDVEACLAELTETARPGTLFVDHSTISPAGATAIHKNLHSHGFRFIDAPITGGSMGAQNGQLTIFCGGDPSDIDEAKTYLSAYAKKAERVGGPGAGQMMKMANQIAVACALLGLCESMSFAEKAGLDLGQTRDLLSGGAAGSWAFEHYGPKLLNRDWSPGFSIKNQHKDLLYCAEAAKDLDVPIPGSITTDQLLEEMIGEGRGEEATVALFDKLLKSGFKP